MGRAFLPTVMASKGEWQYLGLWVSDRLSWGPWGSQASKSVNSFPGSWAATERPRGFPLWGRGEEGENTWGGVLRTQGRPPLQDDLGGGGREESGSWGLSCPSPQASPLLPESLGPSNG